MDICQKVDSEIFTKYCIHLLALLKEKRILVCITDLNVKKSSINCREITHFRGLLNP